MGRFCYTVHDLTEGLFCLNLIHMVRKLLEKFGKKRPSAGRKRDAYEEKRLKKGADDFVKRYGSVIKQLAEE